jgi:hypothetical protein
MSPEISTQELRFRKAAEINSVLCGGQLRTWLVSRYERSSPSGSQTTLRSSSYDVKVAWTEEAATRRLVVGSNTTCEYGRDLGIDLEGKYASNCIPGTHSIKLGPYTISIR